MGRTVRIYAVVGPKQGDCPHRRGWPLPLSAMVAEGHPYHLGTYAYPEWLAAWRPATGVPGCELLIDSGAFSVHNSGRVVGLDDYARFVAETKAALPVPTRFLTLDVIGDQAATWRNYERLVRKGLDVVPVVTLDGMSVADVDRAAGEGYFAVGGMVGAPKTKVAARLDAIFARLTARPGLPRVHLLGVTADWALRRYPAYSCDSAAWLAPLMHRQSTLPGLGRLPSYSEGVKESFAVAAALRANLRDLARRQAALTKLWARRGVEWTSGGAA